MKEFGYQVSKDYEKLWELINKYREVPCFLKGWSFQQNERITGTWKYRKEYDAYSLYSAGSDWDMEAKSKKSFISLCIKYQVTFIDPNPPNPNAIFYADGSEVEVGDKFRYIGHGGGIGVQEGEIILQHGSLGYYIRKIPPRHFSSFAGRVSIKWDNNRITNVEKDEK